METIAPDFVFVGSHCKASSIVSAQLKFVSKMMPRFSWLGSIIQKFMSVNDDIPRDMVLLNEESRMALIVRTSRTIHAPIDLVWKIMSDTDSEPSYWPGMRSVFNIGRSESAIEREVKVIVGCRCIETVKIYPERYSLKYEIHKGPMVGAKSIVATKPSGDSLTKVEIVWAIDFRDLFRILWPMARSYVAMCSRRALINLEKACDSSIKASYAVIRS